MSFFKLLSLYSVVLRVPSVAGLVVSAALVRLHHEGRSELGGVLSLSLVLNVGVEAGLVVGCVGHRLEAAVGQLHGVGAVDGVAVTLLVLGELRPVVGVVHAVRERVGLGVRLVSLVVAAVGVDGGGHR